MSKSEDTLERIRELVYPWLKTGWRKYNEIGKAGFPVKSGGEK